MTNQDYRTKDGLDRRYAIAQAELNAQGRLDERDIDFLALRIAKEVATNEEKVEILESFLKVQQLWSRRCYTTGEGLDEGYLLFDNIYLKNEEDAVAMLRQYYSDEGRAEVAQRYKDSAVLELAYEEELYYYTEWCFTDELREGNFYIELSTGDVIDYDSYLLRFTSK